MMGIKYHEDKTSSLLASFNYYNTCYPLLKQKVRPTQKLTKRTHFPMRKSTLSLLWALKEMILKTHSYLFIFFTHEKEKR